MRFAIAFVAFTALVVTALAGNQPDDKKAIQGSWTVTGANIDGKKVPSEEFQGITFIVAKDKMNFQKGEKKVGEEIFDYRLDSSKKPKTIDGAQKAYMLRPDGGAVIVYTAKLSGIYELQDEKLKIAFAKEAPPKKNSNEKAKDSTAITRPKNYDGGTGIIVLTLKRARK